jgi:uncharacterized protein
VIGGAMLLNGIRSMFGHSASASAFDADRGGGSPWGGSAANSDLARQAGIDDIGRDRGTARGEDSERSGFFGGNDQDDDHDDANTDDGDDGDDEVDYAGDYDDSDTA